MKQYKKIIPVVGFICLLSCSVTYATETTTHDIEIESTSNDSSESLEVPVETETESIFSEYTEIGMKDENGNTLVYIGDNRHIFYDEIYDLYYDEYGTVNKEELHTLGIITDGDNIVETMSESRDIQLNLSVDFENFNVDESTLYDIRVLVTGEPRYVNEEELTEEYADVLLSRTNDFTASKTINATDKTLIMTAYILGDDVNAYRISIDEEEYGYKEYSAEASSYDITLHVILPEGSITDTNLAPSLSETDKKYIDGSYGESRREELKESLEQESNPEQPEQPEEKESKLLGIIILSSIIGIIIIGAGAIYLWRKKIEED